MYSSPEFKTLHNLLVGISGIMLALMIAIILIGLIIAGKLNSSWKRNSVFADINEDPRRYSFLFHTFAKRRRTSMWKGDFCEEDTSSHSNKPSTYLKLELCQMVLINKVLIGCFTFYCQLLVVPRDRTVWYWGVLHSSYSEPFL